MILKFNYITHKAGQECAGGRGYGINSECPLLAEARPWRYKIECPLLRKRTLRIHFSGAANDPFGTLDHGNSTWLDVKFEVNRGVNLEGRLSASRGYFQDYYAASDFEVILYKAYPMRPPTMGARINTQTLASAVPP